MARCHVLLVSIGKLEWHLSRCDTTLRVVCAICLRLRMLPTQWGASCCMNEVCTKHIVYSCAWPTVRDWEASETERTTPYKLLVAHRLQLWSESTWLTIQTWSTFAECSSRFTRSKNPLRMQKFVSWYKKGAQAIVSVQGIARNPTIAYHRNSNSGPNLIVGHLH